jgi:hypothetical protein
MVCGMPIITCAALVTDLNIVGLLTRFQAKRKLFKKRSD